jgi:hypothetical protein
MDSGQPALVAGGLLALAGLCTWLLWGPGRSSPTRTKGSLVDDAASASAANERAYHLDVLIKMMDGINSELDVDATIREIVSHTPSRLYLFLTS